MKPKTRSIICAVALACILPVAPARTAAQPGRAPVYHLDLSYNGRIVGKVSVNTADAQLPSYVLVARGLAPNTQYTFGYTVLGEVYELGSIQSPNAGALVVNGTFPIDDVESLKYLKLPRQHLRLPRQQSAHFWIVETPPASSGRLNGFVLGNYYGWFITKIACYYSTDGGVTWTESSSTDGIKKGESQRVYLSDLGVPDGALVRIHAIVVGGKDRTASERFVCSYMACGLEFTDRYASYYIDGVTWNPVLTFNGTVDIR